MVCLKRLPLAPSVASLYCLLIGDGMTCSISGGFSERHQPRCNVQHTAATFPCNILKQCYCVAILWSELGLTDQTAVFTVEEPSVTKTETGVT